MKPGHPVSRIVELFLLFEEAAATARDGGGPLQSQRWKAVSFDSAAPRYQSKYKHLAGCTLYEPLFLPTFLKEDPPAEYTGERRKRPRECLVSGMPLSASCTPLPAVSGSSQADLQGQKRLQHTTPVPAAGYSPLPVPDYDAVRAVVAAGDVPAFKQQLALLFPTAVRYCTPVAGTRLDDLQRQDRYHRSLLQLLLTPVALLDAGYSEEGAMFATYVQNYYYYYRNTLFRTAEKH
jgi:hypothetical protein